MGSPEVGFLCLVLLCLTLAGVTGLLNNIGEALLDALYKTEEHLIFIGFEIGQGVCLANPAAN